VTNAVKNEKYMWMYTMRGLAILMVIFHHSAAAVTRFGGGAPDLLITIDNAISPFRMPALMFISGMLLLRSMNKPPATYFKGKLAGIAWPYLVWSVIVLVILGDLTWNNMLGVVFVPPTGYWYLWFLLAFYLIAFVTQRVPRPVLIVIALGLAAVAPGFIRADRFCFLFAFFIAGDWAMRTRTQWMPHVRNPWVLVLAGVLTIGTSWLAATGYPVRYDVISTPGVVGAIVLAVALLPGADGFAITKPIQYIGKNSLIFYVVHWPAIALLATILVPATGISGYALFVVSLAVALIASTLLTLSSNRWRVVDVLFRWPLRSSNRAKV
jgi:fucose 4-O-acetylase-like acetyltransferase